MADLAYTDDAAVTELAGQLAIDLRADDGDRATLMTGAISHGSSELDFYCQSKHPAADLAASRWAKQAATAFAIEWWCLHRMNEVPKAVEAWADRYREKLQLVLEGKALVPGCARNRRPVTVTNATVDLQRRNNQVRVDRSRSTGVAQDYTRPTDPKAPDER